MTTKIKHKSITKQCINLLKHNITQLYTEVDKRYEMRTHTPKQRDVMKCALTHTNTKRRYEMCTHTPKQRDVMKCAHTHQNKETL